MSSAQQPPEIERAREDMLAVLGPYRAFESWEAVVDVLLPAAERAVRDTDARVRDHYALVGRALREVGEAVRNSQLTNTQKVGVIAGVLANGPLDDAPGGPCEDAVFAARCAMAREIVDALRLHLGVVRHTMRANDYAEGQEIGWIDAADFIERSFLSHPDNPEGNA